MSREDTPLTPRELARLLRAFAHMLEASAADETPAPRRARRRAAEPQAAPASPETEARARAALRKIGVLP